jgi:hypothetical protein
MKNFLHHVYYVFIASSLFLNGLDAYAQDPKITHLDNFDGPCNSDIITVLLEGSMGTVPWTVRVVDIPSGNVLIDHIPVSTGPGNGTLDGITQFDNTSNNLPIGLVRVEVLDKYGNVTHSSAVHIGRTFFNEAFEFHGSHSYCDLNNGTATVELLPGGTGVGVPAYSYRWTPNVPHTDSPTSSTASNLAPGTYWIDIIDAQGCEISKEIIIQKVEMTVEASTPVEGICGMFSSNLTITDGASPLQILWSDGNTSLSRNDLTTGSYSVTITDANQCQITLDVIIPESQNPGINLSASIEQEIPCGENAGGSITTNISGGQEPYLYEWFHGSTPIAVGSMPTLMGLAPGIYTINVTDHNGCSSTVSIELTDPINEDPLGLTLTVSRGMRSIKPGFPKVCIATITAHVTGGFIESDGTADYTYNWISPGFSGQGFSSLQAIIPASGSVVVNLTVTDKRGCSITESVTITGGCLDSPVDNGGGGSIGTLSISPNPTDGHFEINANILSATSITIDVIEIQTGVNVYNQNLGSQAVGTLVHPVDGTHYSNGYYVVYVSESGQAPESALLLKY